MHRNKIQCFPKLQMGTHAARLKTTICFLMFHLVATTSLIYTHVTRNTCFQVCNSNSCTCDTTNKRNVTSCDQRCAEEHASCVKLICTSGSCVQHCGDCEMQCNEDVKTCSQICLFGSCRFKCSARSCQNQCLSGKCRQTASGDSHASGDSQTSPRPNPYLALLAGLFGACAVLSAIALAMSYYNYCRAKRNTYRRIRSHVGRPVCIERLPSPIWSHYIQK